MLQRLLFCPVFRAMVGAFRVCGCRSPAPQPSVTPRTGKAAEWLLYKWPADFRDSRCHFHSYSSRGADAKRLYEQALAEILQKYEDERIKHWMKEQLEAVTLRRDRMSDADLREQSRRFVGLLRGTIQSYGVTHITGPESGQGKRIHN